MNDRPLVTFFVMTYNQERYIREAVEGAFLQTYSPLEIILSDDCSSDHTFRIMQELAGTYRGPHTVIINQNQKNLGIGGHVNRIMELAHGELIVAAAGDDVSLKERTQVLTRGWLAAGKPSGISSGIIPVDMQGRPLGSTPHWLLEQGRVLKTLPRGDLATVSLMRDQCFILSGCAGAWAKDNWDYFGELNEDVVCEDEVLSFRGCLRGGLYFIEQPLVRYRKHPNNIWGVAATKTLINPSICMESALTAARQAKWKYASYRNMLRDVHTMLSNSHVTPRRAAVINRAIRKKMDVAATMADWWQLSLWGRLRVIHKSRERWWILKVGHLLPLPHYAVVRSRFEQLRLHIGRRRHSWDV